MSPESFLCPYVRMAVEGREVDARAHLVLLARNHARLLAWCEAEGLEPPAGVMCPAEVFDRLRVAGA